jgi:hypothetical protein
MTNVTVTERALVRRINRKLGKLPFPQRLCVLAERSRGYYNLGRFHVVDVYRNAVLDWRVDLVERARDLGVLAANEQLAERPPQ